MSSFNQKLDQPSVDVFRSKQIISRMMMTIKMKEMTASAIVAYLYTSLASSSERPPSFTSPAQCHGVTGLTLRTPDNFRQGRTFIQCNYASVLAG